MAINAQQINILITAKANIDKAFKEAGEAVERMSTRVGYEISKVQYYGGKLVGVLDVAQKGLRQFSIQMRFVASSAAILSAAILGPLLGALREVNNMTYDTQLRLQRFARALDIRIDSHVFGDVRSSFERLAVASQLVSYQLASILAPALDNASRFAINLARAFSQMSVRQREAVIDIAKIGLAFATLATTALVVGKAVRLIAEAVLALKVVIQFLFVTHTWIGLLIVAFGTLVSIWPEGWKVLGDVVVKTGGVIGKVLDKISGTLQKLAAYWRGYSSTFGTEMEKIRAGLKAMGEETIRLDEVVVKSRFERALSQSLRKLGIDIVEAKRLIDSLKKKFAEVPDEAAKSLQADLQDRLGQAGEGIFQFIQTTSAAVTDWSKLTTQMFDAAFGAASSSLEKFILEGGKFRNFMKDFARDVASAIVQMIVKIAAQFLAFTLILTGIAAIVAIFGGDPGQVFKVGFKALDFSLGGFKGAADAGFPKKQHGGMVGLHGPEIVQVGEAGPEMVVPNNKLAALGEGGYGGDTYNIVIQAVDAKSFAELVKRNPESIVQVVQQDLRLNRGIRRAIRDYT